MEVSAKTCLTKIIFWILSIWNVLKLSEFLIVLLPFCDIYGQGSITVPNETYMVWCCEYSIYSTKLCKNLVCFILYADSWVYQSFCLQLLTPEYFVRKSGCFWTTYELHQLKHRCILFLPHGRLDLCCEVISPNYLQCVNILREWVNRKYFIFMPFLFYTFICIICSYFFSDNRAAYFELFFVEQFICTCRCWMANQSNIFLFCLLKM